MSDTTAKAGIKVHLTWTEHYPPIYSLIRDPNISSEYEFEVPQELWERYEQVSREYQEMQFELWEMRRRKGQG